MYIPVTHCQSLTRIQRERLLPLPGKVLVETGQSVAATDILAETRLPNQHLLLDVVQALGISTRQVQEVLNVNVHQHVTRNEVIAGPTGFPPRSLRCPADGRVVFIQNGNLMLELDSPPFQLVAGLEGVVQKVLPERGAILESTGALIQGVWGNGRIAQGSLRHLARSAGCELLADDLDGDLRDAVLLGGHVLQAETFQACKAYNIRGLVLASLPASLLPLAAQCPFPIILLEGFGKIPYNSAAYRILSENTGKRIVVNACHWERYSDARPEVIIPLPADCPVSAPVNDAILTPGGTVRIHSSGLKGQIGTLIALNPEQATLANGMKGPAAIVHLDSGNSTCIPLANLEMLAL